MGRYVQKADGKGSLKCIQILVNEYPELINEKIIEQLSLYPAIQIDWKSPLKCDQFAEYRDQPFLDRLNLSGIHVDGFWPKMGPQWDGLAKSDKGDLFLIEAKANIQEIVSPPSKATGESLRQINRTLNDLKEYMRIKTEHHWTSSFYQYTNRLAHLYFLRVVHQLPAYLVFVYFIGDDSVNGPKTKEEWIAALTVMKKCLGIGSKHRLQKYVTDVFIEVNDMGIE